MASVRVVMRLLLDCFLPVLRVFPGLAPLPSGAGPIPAEPGRLRCGVMSARRRCATHTPGFGNTSIDCSDTSWPVPARICSSALAWMSQMTGLSEIRAAYGHCPRYTASPTGDTSTSKPSRVSARAATSTASSGVLAGSWVTVSACSQRCAASPARVSSFAADSALVNSAAKRLYGSSASGALYSHFGRPRPWESSRERSTRPAPAARPDAS